MKGELLYIVVGLRTAMNMNGISSPVMSGFNAAIDLRINPAAMLEDSGATEAATHTRKLTALRNATGAFLCHPPVPSAIRSR